MTAVNQSSQYGIVPFSVKASGGRISNASGGAVFANFGGDLTLAGYSTEMSNLTSMVLTLEGGTTKLSNIAVKSSTFWVSLLNA